MALRWKSVDKELVFRYTNTAKPVPAGSLLPFWKNHHFQHKMDRRSVGHSDPVQPTERVTRYQELQRLLLPASQTTGQGQS